MRYRGIRSELGWLLSELRQTLRRHPLLLPALAFILGIYYAPYLDPMRGVGVGFVLLSLSQLAHFIQRGGVYLPSWLARLGGLVLVLSLAVLLVRAYERAHRIAEGDLPTEARALVLTSAERIPSGYSLEVELLTSEVRGHHLVFYTRGLPSVGLGDTLELSGLRPIHFEGEERWRASRLSRGISGSVFGLVEGSRPLKGWGRLLTRPRLVGRLLQQRLSERLGRLLPEGQATHLSRAVALGYMPRGRESRELRESFVSSGVAHILAVSGFHLGVVAALLLSLLGLVRWMDARPRLRALVLLVGVWGFTLISGWAVPTVRAALMLSLYLAGALLGRPARLPNVLALSALVQLVDNPFLVNQPSFTLSYAALLSIYLLYRPLVGCVGELYNPLVRFLWRGLCLALSAQALVLPLCLYYWGSSALSFVWASLPMSLFVGVLIPLVWLLLGLSALPLPLQPLTGLVDGLSEVMLEVSRFLGDLPYTQLQVGLTGVQTSALWLLLLFSAWVLRRYYSLWERNLAYYSY